jgi:hypothetical protein
MAESEKIKRYKYIGFNVFPGKTKEFWPSEQDEKKARESARSHFERDQSFLYNPILSKQSWFIQMVAAGITVISFFLPWVNITFGGEIIRANGPAILGSLSFVGSLGAWGSGLELPALIVYTVYLLLSPILGLIYVVTLATVKRDSEKHLVRVKKMSRLFFIPIVLWVAILIIAAIGFPMPLGNLGVKEIGTSFNILSFLSISGAGFYLTLAGCIVCSLMASEI